MTCGPLIVWSLESDRGEPSCGEPSEPWSLRPRAVRAVAEPTSQSFEPWRTRERERRDGPGRPVNSSKSRLSFVCCSNETWQ